MPAFLARAGDRAGPTLFRHVPYCDAPLRGMCLLGMPLGLAVVVGRAQEGPAWSMLAVFGAMWVMYLSIVSVGQIFYGYGWESILLECGALMGLLGSHAVPPPRLMILFLLWSLIRLEFGAGMIKMRGDRSWRDLTAMDHHHETQPMPGPLSRTAHLMPRWWHRAEVLGDHAVRLGIIWLVLAPRPVASFAACAVIATQLFLVMTGNYAWLNWLTILVACAAISDAFWRWSLGGPFPGWSWFGVPLGADGGGAGAEVSSPLWWTALVAAAFALLAVLSRKPLANLFSSHQLMNASFDRFHLVNAYGAFGSMTERRYEVLIEGTEDAAGQEAAEETWQAYEFRGKPGDLRRPPRQVAPYHLRLDWQMWFLAARPGAEPWFVARRSSGSPTGTPGCADCSPATPSTAERRRRRARAVQPLPLRPPRGAERRRTMGRDGPRGDRAAVSAYPGTSP
ncbi:lipase maturation factor family protein [Brachybacterium sp. GPGPB12]|uniref:lipase maturation factor family protein n=1 Tax=Brachybacterium sp. GPGPB12 TaxID=3023517 RepID=UPI0031343B87